MRRIYVVTGELENGQIIIWSGAYPTIQQAEDACYELEKIDSDHIYTWHEVIEEEES